MGAGVSASSAASTFGGSGFNQTTFADAIAANDYISFTLTPTSGYSVSLTSIELYLGKSSSTSVSFTAYLTSSLTGFTASSALDTYTFTNQSAPLRSITLSSSNFSNLTSTVEFRLYGATGTTTDTFRIRNFNDVSDLRINGSATPSAVPEPSTYAAVAGLSALLFAAMRRRRR